MYVNYFSIFKIYNNDRSIPSFMQILSEKKDNVFKIIYYI
jgi:hypothetical protein